MMYTKIAFIALCAFANVQSMKADIKVPKGSKIIATRNLKTNEIKISAWKCFKGVVSKICDKTVNCTKKCMVSSFKQLGLCLTCLPLCAANTVTFGENRCLKKVCYKWCQTAAEEEPCASCGECIGSCVIPTGYDVSCWTYCMKDCLDSIHEPKQRKQEAKEKAEWDKVMKAYMEELERGNKAPEVSLSSQTISEMEEAGKAYQDGYAQESQGDVKEPSTLDAPPAPQKPAPVNDQPTTNQDGVERTMDCCEVMGMLLCCFGGQ